MAIYQGNKKVANSYNITNQEAPIDDTSTDIDKIWSANKINSEVTNITTQLGLLPFKWELIGTSSVETSDTSNNTFEKQMTGGLPFLVYHPSGVFCFGNGVSQNYGKLFGNTSGVIASVTYSETGVLKVSVGSGVAYIYRMKLIEN